jgi:hypothetical protein
MCLAAPEDGSVRHRLQRTVAAGLLAGCLTGAARADVVQWQEFYRERTVCSVAAVERVLVADAVTVELRVDPRWAASLARADRSVADQWFALHCPPAALMGSQPITISARLPNAPVFRFDCQDYLRSQRQRQAQRLAAARAALDSGRALVNGSGNR